MNYGPVTNEKNARAARSEAARVGGARPDRRDGDPDGRAAEPVPQADGAVGRADAEPGRQAQARFRRRIAAPALAPPD